MGRRRRSRRDLRGWTAGSGQKKSPSVATKTDEEMPDLGQADPAPQNVFDNHDAYWWEGGKKVESGVEFAPRKLQTTLDQMTRKQSGRRSRTHTDRKRGRYVQARPANG